MNTWDQLVRLKRTKLKLRNQPSFLCGKSVITGKRKPLGPRGRVVPFRHAASPFGSRSASRVFWVPRPITSLLVPQILIPRVGQKSPSCVCFPQRRYQLSKLQFHNSLSVGISSLKEKDNAVRHMNARKVCSHEMTGKCFLVCGNGNFDLNKRKPQ